jgi:hypothetical protein
MTSFSRINHVVLHHLHWSSVNTQAAHLVLSNTSVIPWIHATVSWYSISLSRISVSLHNGENAHSSGILRLLWKCDLQHSNGSCPLEMVTRSDAWKTPHLTALWPLLVTCLLLIGCGIWPGTGTDQTVSPIVVYTRSHRFFSLLIVFISLFHNCLCKKCNTGISYGFLFLPL